MQRHSPAAERNRSPLFEILNPLLKPGAQVLEIASGTGQHADFICRARPDITWQASDPDEESVQSIQSFHEECRSPAFLRPLRWSVLDPLPPVLDRSFDALVNINMIHIAPWEACLALLDHTKTWLSEGGFLFFYGPFFVKGQPTAESNLAFHESLQERNPNWGLRNLDVLIAEASRRGLSWQKTVGMPANNLSVIFQKVS